MICNLKKYFFNIKLYVDRKLLFLISILLIYSIFIIWSASNENIYIIKWKIFQISVGFFSMIIFAKIPPKIYELFAPYLYILCILLLLIVNFFGHVSKGAQRWLEIGYIHFQPSEIAKISIPLMIARFIYRNNKFSSFSFINVFFLLIIVIFPIILIILQPDLGTAILILFSSFFILFLSGINWRLFFLLFILFVFFSFIYYFFFMHEYQKMRIIMLLYPEIDPFGSGYHIIQSKIAIGSGGFWGKGWLNGTQSKLKFLPECHTDFIFSVLSEEFGFIGVLFLLFLYILIIWRGLYISINAKNIFNKIVSSSLIIVFFTYIFVNIGMVSGILPIVGVPLPLISYGGSSLITLMIGFGIIMSINFYENNSK
ncbi:rod shape-determining protein RodA [Candidatus Westeberhardia cardiocondylae]|nr:rod shape-determining protein RodA [Candidatus Westeberhardia cardiocondylae]